MDGELFRKWIDKLFIPCTIHLQRPILLILDGHGSHLDAEMIDLLVENDIHLYCLPPHTTNILKPLDVGIFRPLKTYFSRITDMVKLATLGSKSPINVCKKNFTAIFKEAYDGALIMTTIKKSFRKCGIVPFNPDAIDKKRLMPDNNSNQTSTNNPTGENSTNNSIGTSDVDMTVEDVSVNTLPGASTSICNTQIPGPPQNHSTPIARPAEP